MDVGGVVILALAALGLFWLSRPLWRRLRLRASATTPAPSSDSVVRRYREDPAPLVRDSVRGYRTGRLDRVLAGDFDLF
jgi:hypothetical protein